MVHFNNDWDEVLAGEFDQNTTSASAISSSRNTPNRPSIPPDGIHL